MDWVESVVRYQYWWQSTITKYLKSKTDSQKQVTASHWKTGINCENPFATHGKANMVEMHIPGTGTKWKRKQSEKVTRKARPVEGGTLCCQTKESAHNYLSQSYLESSWNTRRSTSNELRSSSRKLRFGSLCHLWRLLLTENAQDSDIFPKYIIPSPYQSLPL